MTNNLDNISSTITDNLNNMKKGKPNINNFNNNNTFEDFSNTSFIINTENDKIIDNSLKIVHFRSIKGNNLGNLKNNCNNKNIKYNNENVNRKSICKNINNNCKIF